MEHQFLPYGRQCIEDDDIAAVVRVLKSGWLTTGPEVERFEKALAEYCGARYAVTCANGTAALHLAVLALGLKKGESMLTSPISFLASANCARFVDAAVHFADVDPKSINLDPEKAEKVIAQNKTTLKAILPVHFAGYPARMEAFASLAKQYNLKVVEDGCHALGATYTDKSGELVRVGSCKHSDMTVFSFHPVKGITTGEGGAITTNDEELYRRLLLYRNHGMIRSEDEAAFEDPMGVCTASGARPPWYYEMQELGYNYRITDIQCALGRSQLAKLDRFLAHKEKLAALYRQLIQGSELLSSRVQPHVVEEGIRPGHHLFVVQIDFEKVGISRMEFMERLHSRGIGSQVHYIPLHFQPYYRRHCRLKEGALPVAESYYERCLSLPLFAEMKEKDVERVVEVLSDIFGESREC